MSSSGRNKQQQSLASFFAPKGVSDSKAKPNIKPNTKSRPKLEPSKPSNEETDGTEDKMNKQPKIIRRGLESKSSVAAEFNSENKKKNSTDDVKTTTESKKEEQDLVDTDDENNLPRSKEEKDGISTTTNIIAKKHDLKSKDHSSQRKKARRVIEDDGDSMMEELPEVKSVGTDIDSEYGEDVSDIDDGSLMEDTDDEQESLQTLAQDSKNKKKRKQLKLSSKENKCINSTLKHPSITPNLSKVSSKKSSSRPLTNEKLLESDKSKWTKDSQILYSILCSTLSDIEAISSRLEIQNHLTTLFRR